jgi:hypothetical protein
MANYFNGLDRNHPEVLGWTHANVSANMDTAEQRLIGCFVPPERRNGAIAFWTIPAFTDSGQGHAITITARRFPDAPDDTIAGENWKVIHTQGKIGFFDPDAHRVVIGLPIADLLALRAGSLDSEGNIVAFDCDGNFVPYEETIRKDYYDQPIYANKIDLGLLETIGVNDFLDSHEHQSPDELAACHWVAFERTLWIDWNADADAPQIIHPPIGGKYGYGAPF